VLDERGRRRELSQTVRILGRGALTRGWGTGYKRERRTLAGRLGQLEKSHRMQLKEKKFRVEEKKSGICDKKKEEPPEGGKRIRGGKKVERRRHSAGAKRRQASWGGEVLG